MGNFIQRSCGRILAVHLDIAGELSLIVMRNETVDQPCDRCFATAAFSAQNHDLTVGNRQADVVNAILFTGIGIAYILEKNAPIMIPGANFVIMEQTASRRKDIVPVR